MMTGHEQETPAKGGLNPFNGEVEFVPWKRRHDHVTEHQVEVLNHDSSQSLHPVFHLCHLAGIGFEENFQCCRQLLVVLQHKDVERLAAGRGPRLGGHKFERVGWCRVICCGIDTGYCAGTVGSGRSAPSWMIVGVTKMTSSFF